MYTTAAVTADDDTYIIDLYMFIIRPTYIFKYI